MLRYDNYNDLIQMSSDETEVAPEISLIANKFHSCRLAQCPSFVEQTLDQPNVRLSFIISARVD